MMAMPGYTTFLFGNAKKLGEWKTIGAKLEKEGGRPLKQILVWLHDYLDPTQNGREDCYDASKSPVVIVNFGTNVQLHVADPEMVQDLFVKKNSIYDKTGNFEGIFSKLLGSSFLFSKADELWKAKRKACAHAFYKERLVIMIETLKDKLEEDIKLWAQTAKSSYYKSKKVDFSVVWNELFTRNILHIAFGEDIS